MAPGEKTPADRKVMVFELIDAVLKSWWTVVAGSCLGLAAGLLMLNHTPAVYQAGARLDAFAEMLPSEFVRPTVADDAEVRLKAVQKELLARPDLGAAVMARLPGDHPPEDEQALASEVRSSVSVSFRTRTRFFDVLYRSPEPHRAAMMANAVADLFIEENARQRAEMSEQNTRTLEALAASVYEDLQAQEQEIAGYRSAHRFETSDQLLVNQQMLDQRREDLASNREAQLAVEERIMMLEAQKSEGGLYSAPAATGEDAAPVPALTGDTRLSELQAELDQLLLRYSENHPNVIAVRRQIDDLRKRAPVPQPRNPDKPEAEGDPAPVLDVASLQWRLQSKAAQRELQDLKQQEQAIRRDIATYERRIAAASHVDATLREKSRGVEALRQQFEKLQRDILQARSAQQVEESQKGLRFKVVDVATAPTTPVYPNPPLVLGVGALAGLALFGGPPVFRRLLRPLVGSESGLKQISQVPVLVSIPMIPSPGRARAERRRLLKNFGLSFASVAALAAVVALHFFERL